MPPHRHLDIATIPEPTTADEARRQILENTARLIQSGNTAIMPTGVIVARGTPGSMDYESANRQPVPPTRVVMFRPEFEAPILAGTKHHTVRGPAKRPWKPITLLSLRVWTGKPYRSKQREFFLTPLLRVEGIRIHRDGVEMRPGTVGGFWIGERGANRPHLEAFARADGFPSWDAMRGLFREMRGIDVQPFDGQLIRWRETP